MTENPTPVHPPQTPFWDESRTVVFLIGFCLILEAGLVYLQAGDSQAVVSSIVGLSGVSLLLFAWLVPLEDEGEEAPQEEEPSAPLTALKLPVSTEVQPLERRVEPPPSIVTEPEKVPISEAQPGLLPEAERPPAAVVTPILPIEEEPALSWFDRLRGGLKKTRDGFIKRLKTLVMGTTKIDGDLLDEIEGLLYESDIGVNTAKSLLEILHARVEKEEIKDAGVIYKILKDLLREKLKKYSPEPRLNPSGMTVFLIIGVNGVGKTTTIAKLAYKYMKDGKKVMLAAADTFRAAAIDQLCIWGDRVGVEVIRSKEGGDPGALVFDAIHAGRKRQADLLIIDTAGRMHVKTNLMDELKKIRKIAEKETDGGPHETLLVIDANTGQNAVQQAKLFNEALPITGLIMTKLDGTAKGGVLFAVEEQLNVPVKFIGVGEKMGDLMPFQPEQFLDALFDDDDKSKKSDYKVL